MQYEKDVPIPKLTRYHFDQMEVGDSVFFESVVEADNMASSANSYAKTHKNGFKVSRRKVEGGYRVWRVQ